MNYTQIAYAVAVADTLNFTEAAKINGVSQPTLTFRITKLEEEFGYKLFNRTTKKVELTEAGKVFVDGAKKVVRRTEELEKIAVEQKKILSNTINIGLNNNYYHLGLTDYIAEYSMSHPDVYINLITAGEQNSFGRLESGELDFSFYKKNDSWELPENIAWFPLTREKLYAVGKKEIIGTEPVTVQALSKMKLFTSIRDNSNVIKVIKDLGLHPDEMINPVKINLSSTFGSAGSVPFFDRGYGIGLCSEGLAKQFTEQGDISMQPIEPEYYLNPGLIHIKKKLTPLQEDFKNFILKKFSII